VTLNGFEQGYREGWMSVAGTEPLPENPTQPQPGERRDYDNGYFYGRADALDRFKPGAEPTPVSYQGRRTSPRGGGLA
jgi:hypothetical protein